MKSISTINPAITDNTNVRLLRCVPQLSSKLEGVSLNCYASFPATSNTLLSFRNISSKE